jgi:hypothetical protein
MTVCRRLRKQFFVEKVHLAEIGLSGVFGDPRSVLHGHPVMRVISDTMTGHKLNRRNRCLRERMLALSMYRYDLS